MQFVPFSSQTRMSGVDFGDVHIRKGAADVMFTHIEMNGNPVSESLRKEVEKISLAGGLRLSSRKTVRRMALSISKTS